MATQTAVPTRAPEDIRAQFRNARRMPQLLECRERCRLALRQTSDAMDENGDNGDSNSDLKALWTQLEALMSEISDKISRTATIDDLDRRARGEQVTGSGDVTWDRQCSEFSIRAVIAAQCGIAGVDVGRERETSAELARRSDRSFAGIPVPVRALSVNQQMADSLGRRMERRVITSGLPATGPGGNLIGTFLDPTQYIDVLRPAMVVRQLGARVLSDLRSNLDLPRLSGATTYGWFAENSAIPTSDETFDRVQLRPRHAGAILEVSRNMLQQSTPDIEAVIRDDLAQVLARAVDSAALVGPAGNAIEPMGIIYNPDVSVVAGAAPTYDQLVDITTAPATLNALAGSLGWASNMAVRGALLKLKDGMQRPYGLDVLGQGYPFGFTNLATDSTNTDPLIFGNFNDMILGMWSEIDLLVNPYGDAAFSKGNVQLRGALTMDVALRHPESFAWCPLTLTVGP